jgi:outer membrane protein OmpA-like peptidoglycan-associated protein
MSRSLQARRRSVSVAVVLAVLLICVPVLLNAQDEAPPKIDLFVGYQWLNPGGTVPVGSNPPFQPPPSPLLTRLPSMLVGYGVTGTYNFNKVWGLSVDVGGNFQDKASESTISVGPRVMWRGEGVNLFAHTLLGLNRLSPKDVHSSNGIGAILGGGIDIRLFKPISWRLIEADYVLGRHSFTDVVPITEGNLQRPVLNGVRLRTGIVLNIGGGAPEALVAASCSVDHSEVMVGEPVHVTVSPSNFNPKHTLAYNWSTTGGKLEGKDTTASIDTNGLAGGSYTATARVTDPKAKKNNEASCTSNFTVKEPPKNPPQISCSASPTSVVTGSPATVSCSCTSPDNVPVTVGGWTASSGSISGSGNSATLTTTGAPAGSSTVNATCTDSRGLTASASSSVTIENPPPPKVDTQLEARLALHSVYFPTAQPTVQNPNAGLVASQEQTLQALATDFAKYREVIPDAHLTLEGHADVRGSVPYNQALSERRVARVKSYLIEHGVPEANIDTKAFGSQHNLTAAEVKAQVEQNPDLTKEERARILRNMRTIILANNRRVDITLNSPGREIETSVRRYPFNAADSLTLIGGREAAKKKAPAAKKAPAKSPKK